MALGRMLQNAGDAMEAAARQGKIHPTDLRCISLLASSPGPVGAKDVINELGLTSGSGTALFDRLERLGFTRRIPSNEDRRSVIIELDRDAADAPLALLEALRERYHRLTDRFSEQELDVISDFLEAVATLSTDHE
jgi:DNA-binding MarR family transcriptional regulator